MMIWVTNGTVTSPFNLSVTQVKLARGTMVARSESVSKQPMPVLTMDTPADQAPEPSEQFHPNDFLLDQVEHGKAKDNDEVLCQ